MRLYFSTGALYGLPVRLAAGMAARAGCDGVELVLDPLSLLVGPRFTGRELHRARMPVGALHPPLFGIPGWTRQPNAFRELGRWALALECPLIVMHPPRNDDLALRTAQFDLGLAALRQVVGDSVQLTVENVAVFHPDKPPPPYVWPEKVAAFAEERGLGVTFDTTHAASAGLAPLEAYETLAAKVRHVHLSDFRTPCRLLDRPSLDTYCKHHQLPDEGETDLAALLRRLRSDRYDGGVTLELSPVALRAWRPGEATRLLGRSVECVRGMLAEPRAKAPRGLGALSRMPQER